jgi:hypothetical protein
MGALPFLFSITCFQPPRYKNLMSVDFHLGEGGSRSAILWTVEHADGVKIVKERNMPQYWEHSTRHINTWPQTSYIWNCYANSETGKKKWRVIMRGFICLTQWTMSNTILTIAKQHSSWGSKSHLFSRNVLPFIPPRFSSVWGSLGLPLYLMISSSPCPRHEGMWGESYSSTCYYPRQWMEARSSRSGRFTPGKEPHYPLNTTLGASTNQSRSFGKEKK